MATTNQLSKITEWWRTLDHSLKPTPTLEPGVQDARAYDLFFRQFAAQWKLCRKAALMLVEPNHRALIRTSKAIADELSSWLDRAREQVFERGEATFEGGQFRVVRKTIGEPIRSLFDRWMAGWYERFEEFKEEPLKTPPHREFGFDSRRPELVTNPRAITSRERTPGVSGLWRFPHDAGELYNRPNAFGRPLPPPPEALIDVSPDIPGSSDQWDWLEYSWRLELSGIGTQLNEYYETLSESPWLVIKLLDMFAGDCVPRRQNSLNDGDPLAMHPFISKFWVELINHRYLNWCVRHFPPNTPLDEVNAVAPGPPDRIYEETFSGPTGRDPGFTGRIAHPLACVVAFLLDDLTHWVDAQTQSAPKRQLSKEDLKFAAVKWRGENPKGTQKEFAQFMGVSATRVSRHANFAELDEMLGDSRRVQDREIDLDGMQVRRRPS